MAQKGELIRRSVSIWLAVLTLGLSVAVPVLERADLVHEPVAESQHEPGSCPSAHDHTVCTQVGANLAAVQVGQPYRGLEHHSSLDAPLVAIRAVQAQFPEGHRSRAPPFA